MRNGRTVGGGAFRTGALTQLLQNPVYAGKVRHKDEVYEGAHDAILSPDQFDQAQAIFAANRVKNATGKHHRSPSLLTGILADPDGRPMSPSHAKKAERRYRYYISRREPQDTSDKWRMPAGEIERLVIDAVAKQLTRVRSNESEEAEQLAERIEAQQALAADLPTMSIAKQRSVLLERKVQVRVHEDRIDLALAPPGNSEIETISIKAKLVSRGYDVRLAVPPHEARPARDPDPVLLRLIAHGFAARDLLVEGTPSLMIADYSQRHLQQLTRLAYLAPDIISSIIDGTQPVDLTGRKILRIGNLPLCWKAQREMLGFA